MLFSTIETFKTKQKIFFVQHWIRSVHLKLSLDSDFASGWIVKLFRWFPGLEVARRSICFDHYLTCCTFQCSIRESKSWLVECEIKKSWKKFSDDFSSDGRSIFSISPISIIGLKIISLIQDKTLSSLLPSTYLAHVSPISFPFLSFLLILSFLRS